MKLAIMQPYFIPYIGYFQLMKLVDKFVIYDDVNYINKGWINRNNILVNGSSKLLTVPLKKSSQNKLIYDIYIANEENWVGKTLKTLELSYKKAPYFGDVFALVAEVLTERKEKICDLNSTLLYAITNYLSLEVEFTLSSSFNNSELSGQDRIIDICQKENATTYVNPTGGKKLYSKEYFAENDIQLGFLETKSIEYKQFSDNFVPWLSIIDLMMFNSKADLDIFLTLCSCDAD